MRINCTLYLLDVVTSQDAASGRRVYVLQNNSKVVGELSNVGMKTYWTAVAAQVRLDRSLVILNRSFHGERYVYLKQDGVYEIINTANGKSPLFLRLNLKRVNDPKLKEVITGALG